MEFGVGVTKEMSAGKIRYGGWDNALNIVGAGTTGNPRVVRVFDALKLGGAHLVPGRDDWIRVLNNPNPDGWGNNNENYTIGIAAKNMWAKDGMFAPRFCIEGTNWCFGRSARGNIAIVDRNGGNPREI